MNNAKTTTLGVLTILSVIIAAAKLFLNGHGMDIDWSTTIAAITSGIGLIFAKDAHQAPVDPDRLPPSVKPDSL